MSQVRFAKRGIRQGFPPEIPAATRCLRDPGRILRSIPDHCRVSLVTAGIVVKRETIGQNIFPKGRGARSMTIVLP